MSEGRSVKPVETVAKVLRMRERGCTFAEIHAETGCNKRTSANIVESAMEFDRSSGAQATA